MLLYTHIACPAARVSVPFTYICQEDLKSVHRNDHSCNCAHYSGGNATASSKRGLVCCGNRTACIVGLFQCESFVEVRLLKPTGHVMHQQFNIQQLYALPTVYLCVLYLSENKQRLVPLTA